MDSVEDYLATLKEVFDFPAIKALVSRPDFSIVFDAMNAVTGAYANPILVGELGASPDSVMCAPPAPPMRAGQMPMCRAFRGWPYVQSLLALKGR